MYSYPLGQSASYKTGGCEHPPGKMRVRSLTFILEAGWMSSVMETLSCWSLLLTSLEQQMLTELRTCQELYSTKERLSMTRVPSAPFLRRVASFLGSITLRGSLSPAITGRSPLWPVGSKGWKGRAGTPAPVSPRGMSEGEG